MPAISPESASPSEPQPSSAPTHVSDAEKREHLRKLVGGFDTAMLVTRSADGGMRSRPLAIAEKRDDALYFATAAESPKVDEIEADPHVNVAMQDGRRYVSLSGVARLIRDRGLVERLWSESWKVWFPEGKDDPSLRILVVNPTEAAYWDGSGAHGLKYMFEMAKAYVTGTKPSSDDDETHTARVKM